MTPTFSVSNTLLLPLFFTLSNGFASRFRFFAPLPGLFPSAFGEVSLGAAGHVLRLLGPSLLPHFRGPCARPAVTVIGPSSGSFSVLIVSGNGPLKLDGPFPAPITATSVCEGPVGEQHRRCWHGAALCLCHAAEMDEDPDQSVRVLLRLDRCGSLLVTGC